MSGYSCWNRPSMTTEISLTGICVGERFLVVGKAETVDVACIPTPILVVISAWSAFINMDAIVLERLPSAYLDDPCLLVLVPPRSISENER